MAYNIVVPNTNALLMNGNFVVPPVNSVITANVAGPLPTAPVVAGNLLIPNSKLVHGGNMLLPVPNNVMHLPVQSHAYNWNAKVSGTNTTFELVDHLAKRYEGMLRCKRCKHSVVLDGNAVSAHEKRCDLMTAYQSNNAMGPAAAAAVTGGVIRHQNTNAVAAPNVALHPQLSTREAFTKFAQSWKADKYLSACKPLPIEWFTPLMMGVDRTAFVIGRYECLMCAKCGSISEWEEHVLKLHAAHQQAFASAVAAGSCEDDAFCMTCVCFVCDCLLYGNRQSMRRHNHRKSDGFAFVDDDIASAIYPPVCGTNDQLLSRYHRFTLKMAMSASAPPATNANKFPYYCSTCDHYRMDNIGKHSTSFEHRMRAVLSDELRHCETCRVVISSDALLMAVHRLTPLHLCRRKFGWGGGGGGGSGSGSSGVGNGPTSISILDTWSETMAHRSAMEAIEKRQGGSMDDDPQLSLRMHSDLWLTRQRARYFLCDVCDFMTEAPNAWPKHLQCENHAKKASVTDALTQAFEFTCASCSLILFGTVWSYLMHTSAKTHTRNKRALVSRLNIRQLDGCSGSSNSCSSGGGTSSSKLSKSRTKVEVSGGNVAAIGRVAAGNVSCSIDGSSVSSLPSTGARHLSDLFYLAVADSVAENVATSTMPPPLPVERGRSRRERCESEPLDSGSPAATIVDESKPKKRRHRDRKKELRSDSESSRCRRRVSSSHVTDDVTGLNEENKSVPSNSRSSSIDQKIGSELTQPRQQFSAKVGSIQVDTDAKCTMSHSVNSDSAVDPPPAAIIRRSSRLRGKSPSVDSSVATTVQAAAAADARKPSAIDGVKNARCVSELRLQPQYSSCTSILNRSSEESDCFYDCVSDAVADTLVNESLALKSSHTNEDAEAYDEEGRKCVAARAASKNDHLANYDKEADDGGETPIKNEISENGDDEYGEYDVDEEDDEEIMIPDENDCNVMVSDAELDASILEELKSSSGSSCTANTMDDGSKRVINRAENGSVVPLTSEENREIVRHLIIVRGIPKQALKNKRLMYVTFSKYGEIRRTYVKKNEPESLYLLVLRNPEIMYQKLKDNILNLKTKFDAEEISVEYNTKSSDGPGIRIMLSKEARLLFSKRDELNESVNHLEQIYDTESKSASSREKIQRLELLIKDLAQSLYQHTVLIKVHIFGSRVTGLAAENSDVDIYLQLGNSFCGSMHTNTILQQRLVFLFTNKMKLLPKHFQNVISISFARVPIVKFTDVCSGLNCDLSFKSGLSTMNSILVKTYLGLDFRVKYLVCAVKLWMKLNNFADRHLFTTYAQIWMVLFFLMQADIAVVPTLAYLRRMLPENQREFIVEDWNCAFPGVGHFIWRDACTLTKEELLKKFFEFYSDVKLNNYVLCTLTGIKIQKKHFLEYYDNLPSIFNQYKYKVKNDSELFRRIYYDFDGLCVQDPFDHSHNLTKTINPRKFINFTDVCRETVSILDV